MKQLNEDSRSDLIQRSRRSDDYQGSKAKGRNRYYRRLKSRVLNSVDKFNSINMDKLFKQGILDIVVDVRGETDDYEVKISFSGFLQELNAQLPDDATEDDINLLAITRALVNCLNKNSNDIFVHCDCKDFQYRHAYWATVNGINAGDDELRPSEDTNPDDTIGPGCKHIMLVLANNSWIRRVASVIRNYIKYMREHRQQLYANVIYPAIFDKDWDEPSQQDMFNAIDGLDDNELPSDEDTINTSNKWARTKNQFKPGNPNRFQRDDNKQIQGQKEFDIDSMV